MSRISELLENMNEGQIQLKIKKPLSDGELKQIKDEWEEETGVSAPPYDAKRNLFYSAHLGDLKDLQGIIKNMGIGSKI